MPCQVEVLEFERQLGGSCGIPHDGGFSLGLGDSMVERETFPFLEFESKNADTRRRCPTTVKADLLEPIQVEERMELLGLDPGDYQVQPTPLPTGAAAPPSGRSSGLMV